MSRPGARALVAVAALAACVVATSACATGPRAGGGAAAPAHEAVNAPLGVAAAAADDDAEDDVDDGEPEVDSAPAPSTVARSATSPCPSGMALVATTDPPRRFCVDAYEASLVEVMPDGTEHPFPHFLPVDGHDVRAVSLPGVFPQGFISEVQAEDACAASKKRLCRADEWKTACMGPARTTFPYGDVRRPGVCHDSGKSAVVAVFGAKAVLASTPGPAITSRATATATAPSGSAASAAATAKRGKKTGKARGAAKAHASAAKASDAHAHARHGGKKRPRYDASVDPGVWARLNEPALGRVEGALAKTGDHPECVNAFGVFDMVGNLHEWVATDPSVPHGTFAGGYYLDTALNGDGCNYRTVAHAHEYHDYSTGFRCCADASP